MHDGYRHDALIEKMRRRLKRRLWIQRYVRPWLPPVLYDWLFAVPYTPPRPIPAEWLNDE